MSKKKTGKLLIIGAVVIGVYALARKEAKKWSEDKSIDVDNPYIGQDYHLTKENDMAPTFYEQSVKPVLDKVLSFTGLVVLSPVYLGISLAIVMNDPGPVLFTQKRVGKDGKYFMLHKFRTMKMSTPHDVPTHLLTDPESYITAVGRVLRKTSLDELPQIWDIFRGKMSIIGPRPALWNQDDLVESRGFANTALSGLTGLAQISGRDELEIKIKAKLDQEYVRILRSGNLKGFALDCRCFFGTVLSVLKHDGVVEGGTGSLPAPSKEFQITTSVSSTHIRFPVRPGVPEEDPEVDWGYLKHFSVDTTRQVRVLITGADSYIGESFRRYTMMHYPSIHCDTLDMKGNDWQEYDFSKYDCVFHVAGIAHADVGKAEKEIQELYYSVNTDLAVAAARIAKEAGVKQFIFMSSMIIYGGKQYINIETKPVPSNFYGDSKWQGDKGVRSLSSPDFNVAVLRPPMIYGLKCKGNYPILASIAKQFPLFPKVDNCRSMLYVENLCEFVSLLVFTGEGGVYFPQNKEYANTGGLVSRIGKTHNKQVVLTKMLSPAVWIASKVPGKLSRLVNKAFGSSYYDQKLSTYSELDYQKYSLGQSIERTETGL